MKKIVPTIFLLTFSVSVFAQLKVNSSTGKVLIGPERTNHDLNNILSASIFGQNGEYKAGAKLAFGDFGKYEYGGVNVFIGEYGTTDTDQLWLHGKKGIYLTYNNSDNVIAYYDIAAGNKFTFNCDVYSQGVKLTSDERFKKNINPLDNSLSLLNQLNGVSYYYDGNVLNDNSSPQAAANLPENKAVKVNTDEELAEKEKADLAFFEDWESRKANGNKKRIGFIAQDLQEIFPELVEKDSSGFFHVDYIGLIPVIVESIKEQQQIIDVQSEKIKEMENILNKLTGTASLRFASDGDSATDIQSVSTKSVTNTFLYQNAPNPFSVQTEIRYFLPQEIQQAYICIFDMQGKMLKKLDALTGENTLTIRGSELQAGMYLYSLIADGKEVDTKKMILTD
ncbi:MAG: tail fiber domain-containing protein [Dysgonamonadaceae bacterium]|jgi:hypothetical protein|nr:tail fiber domain-containing protein [Dysgonamonadaceae bacterium]